MKRGAFILNPARGELINEIDLLSALDEGIIAGAWLDVFHQEPYSGPLCSRENVILTPHIASYTVEGRNKMENEAAENLIKGFKEWGLL